MNPIVPALDWRGIAVALCAHLLVLAWLFFSPKSVPAAAEPVMLASLILPESPVEPGPPPPPPPPPPRPNPEPPKPVEPPKLLTVPEPVRVPEPAVEVPPPPPKPEPPIQPPPAVEPPPPAPALPLAPAPRVEPAPVPKVVAVPTDTDDFRRYIASLMRELNRHKRYPAELKRARIEGRVVLEFSIDRHGRLLASGIKQGSGHPELDRAALSMLSRANPLPGIPAFMNKSELALTIPIEYSLITDR